MRPAASHGTETQEPASHRTTPPGTRQPAPHGEPVRQPSLADVYEPIEAELKIVESLLRAELKNETPFVDQLLEHSWMLGGKRIRPVFLLLSAASCGKVTQAHYQLAAALEMIHTATLVHDDVLDKAETRRHQATVNSTWGNKVSVLLGDYLFTNAFFLASRAGSAETLQMLAQASNRVCEGEMRQNDWQGNFELSEADYLQMITEKTAELCGAGCRIGAFLAEADSSLVDRFETYGRNLGVAFQIIDDVLDLVGQQQQVGKTLGTDLANQKPTLPIIHCLENSPAAQRSDLHRILKQPGSTTSDVLPFLKQTKSLAYARQVAQQHAQASRDFAASLPSSIYSDALQNLAEFVLQRTH